MLNLLVCRCQDEGEFGGCGYKFTTNDLVNLDCPSCGCIYIDWDWKKAIVLDDIPSDKLDDTFYTNKVQELVKEAVDMASQSFDLKELIVGWFKSKNIVVPKEVHLTMGTHFDFSEEGDRHLVDILCLGSNYQLSYEEHDELSDLIALSTLNKESQKPSRLQ